MDCEVGRNWGYMCKFTSAKSTTHCPQLEAISRTSPGVTTDLGEDKVTLQMKKLAEARDTSSNASEVDTSKPDYEVLFFLGLITPNLLMHTPCLFMSGCSCVFTTPATIH